MDNRSFIARLAKAADIDNKDASRLSQALCDIMAQCAADNDNVAIPGFGTFVAVKNDERVVTDTESGKRTLLPPEIKVSFRPGSRLKKSVAQS
ncbi:MAG: HU family DNA-binding protein [Muribaculaceae bacterium]|nr:HU family DNA-binding protein [Muribaculaceae bacterium]